MDQKIGQFFDQIFDQKIDQFFDQIFDQKIDQKWIKKLTNFLIHF